MWFLNNSFQYVRCHALICFFFFFFLLWWKHFWPRKTKRSFDSSPASWNHVGSAWTKCTEPLTALPGLGTHPPCRTPLPRCSHSWPLSECETRVSFPLCKGLKIKMGVISVPGSEKTNPLYRLFKWSGKRVGERIDTAHAKPLSAPGQGWESISRPQILNLHFLP